MINEERVKQLYKIAIYEKNEEKANKQTGLYYRSDYVGKELIKSIFTGTFAYMLLVVLWAISNMDTFIQSINNLEIINTAIEIIIIYVGFMAIYLFATLLVYLSRYTVRRKRLEAYKENLKIMNQMYEREEKLKL